MRPENSLDYSVIKWNDPEDHVATIHGFKDDMKSCQFFVDALNKHSTINRFQPIP